MSRSNNRHNPWAKTPSNPTSRRVFDDDDDSTSNMQMARRSHQPSRPSQPTSAALTRLPAERVESWRSEKRGDDDLDGAVGCVRGFERRPVGPCSDTAAPQPRTRQRSPSYSPPPARRREAPRGESQRRHAPSRRTASPAFDDEPAHTHQPQPRRAAGPDRFNNETARTHQPQRRSTPPFDEPTPPPRRHGSNPRDEPTHSFPIYTSIYTSTSSTTRNGRISHISHTSRTSYSTSSHPASSHSTSTRTAGRTRATHRSSRHGLGVQHDDDDDSDTGCRGCFETCGGAEEWGEVWYS